MLGKSPFIPLWLISTFTITIHLRLISKTKHLLKLQVKARNQDLTSFVRPLSVSASPRHNKIWPDTEIVWAYSLIWPAFCNIYYLYIA